MLIFYLIFWGGVCRTKKRHIAPPAVAEQSASNKKSATTTANLFNHAADASVKKVVPVKTKARLTKKGDTTPQDPAPIDVDKLVSAKKGTSKAAATKSRSRAGEKVSTQRCVFLSHLLLFFFPSQNVVCL